MATTSPPIVVSCPLAGGTWAWRPAEAEHPAVLLIEETLTPRQLRQAITAASTHVRGYVLRPVRGSVFRVKAIRVRTA